MKVVIIGYGNPLRGDDGVGWYVAGRLAEIADEKTIQVLACHQLTPELAPTIAAVEHVIFIDADCGHSPGEISRQNVRPEAVKKVLTHTMSPTQLLGLARDLYQGKATGELYTVGGQSFDHREDLSPVVRRACDQLITQIRGFLGRVQADEQAHGSPREMYGYA